MNAHRRLATVLATAALSGGLAGPTFAADTATVNANVTMAAPCVTVESTSLDFGVQGFSLPNQDATSARPISFASCSDAGESIYVHGTDAVDASGGGTTWTLVGSQVACPDRGLNKYRVKLRSTGGFGSFDLLNNSWLLGGFGPGAPSQLDEVQLVTPCAGSDGSGLTMSFQVIFTATF